MLRLAPESDLVPCRDVAARADEEVVEGQDALTILKSCLRHRYLRCTLLSAQDGCDGIPHLWRKERHQDDIEPLRVGIDGDDRLSIHILRGVRYHAVLSQGDDQVFLGKEHRWGKASIEKLDFEVGWKRTVCLLHSLAVDSVLALVLAKVSACMFDVEPSLSNGIEALNKLGEAGFLGKDKDLVGHHYILGLPI